MSSAPPQEADLTKHHYFGVPATSMYRRVRRSSRSLFALYLLEICRGEGRWK
jgi:hypothetical protein